LKVTIGYDSRPKNAKNLHQHAYDELRGMTTQPTKWGKIGSTMVANGYDTREALPKLWNSLSKRVVTRKSWPLGPQGIFAKKHKGKQKA
jgi:hypothetical protein